MADYRIKRPASDENLVGEVIGPATDAWAEATTPEEETRVLNAMTQGQRLMMAYVIYWDECTSGDHATFFWNTSGNLWEQALEATRVMRLPDEKILRDAVALIQDGRPSTITSERRRWLEQLGNKGKLEALDKKMEKLDTRWSKLPDRDHVLKDYINRHADDFFRPDAG